MAYTLIIQRFNMFKGVQPSTSGVRATTELNESSDQRYFQLEGDIWNNFLYDCTLSYKSNPKVLEILIGHVRVTTD